MDRTFERYLPTNAQSKDECQKGVQRLGNILVFLLRF